MGDIGQEVIESLCRLSQLRDFFLRSGKDLRPLVDDDLSEPADKEDHDQMECGSGEHQTVELFSIGDHDPEIIGHCDIVGNLTERDQRFFACHGHQHDQRRHDDRQVKGTRRMDTIEKGRTHHEHGVDADTDDRGRVLTEMHDPADDHSDRDEKDHPFFPSHQECLADQGHHKSGVCDKQHQM